MGFVDLRLAGPVADDERNHLLHYRLTRGNVGRIKEAEKDLLVRKLINTARPKATTHTRSCAWLERPWGSRQHKAQEGSTAEIAGLIVQGGTPDKRNVACAHAESKSRKEFPQEII